jgi:hypothetical protein
MLKASNGRQRSRDSTPWERSEFSKLQSAGVNFIIFAKSE